MTRVNNGADMQADELGGGSYGATGAYTGSSTTGLTGATGLVASAHIGKMIVVAGVFGVVISNTTTAFVVDQWYVPGTLAAGTTPATSGTFSVLPGRAPAMYMAITTDTGAANVTDTTLPTEIVAASSGCLRKIATYAHTTNATSYTMTATYTYTSTDAGVGSRIIHKMGMFNSVLGATGLMQFETVLNADATLTALGDQLTVQQTVSM